MRRAIAGWRFRGSSASSHHGCERCGKCERCGRSEWELGCELRQLRKMCGCDSELRKMWYVPEQMRFGAECDIVRYVWTRVGLPVRNVSLLVEARHFRNKSSRKVTMKVRPSGRYLWSQNEWSTGDFANLVRKLCCCSCCSSIEELVRCLRSY